MEFWEKTKRKFSGGKKIFVTVLLFFFLLASFFVIRAVSHEKENEEESFKAEEREAYPVLVEEKKSGADLEVAAAASFYLSEDGDEKMLFEKNSEEALPIASISKLMTALVVFENYELDEPVLITEREILERSEFRDFRAFYETEVKEMIYPMLIESNNSAAFALALISERFLEGSSNDSIDIFVDKMNKKAEELGLGNTLFINPSGLDGRGHYNLSTAREIIKFSEYLLFNTDIFEITSKPSYKLYSPDKTIYYESLNTNDFLHGEKEGWEEDIVGGKTGWTHAAFGCLLLVLEAPTGNGYVINVVLGAEDRFLEMGKLVDHVYSIYEF